MRKRIGIFGGIVFWLAAGSLPGSEPITISVEEGRLHGVFEEAAAQANASLWISPASRTGPCLSPPRAFR